MSWTFSSDIFELPIAAAVGIYVTSSSCIYITLLQDTATSYCIIYSSSSFASNKPKVFCLRFLPFSFALFIQQFIEVLITCHIPAHKIWQMYLFTHTHTHTLIIAHKQSLHFLCTITVTCNFQFCFYNVVNFSSFLPMRVVRFFFCLAVCWHLRVSLCSSGWFFI